MTARRSPSRPSPRLLPEADCGVAPELMDYLFAGAPEPEPLQAAPPAPPPARPSPPGRGVARQVGAVLVESRLAGMGDADVRSTLARKLCRLLPDLPPGGADNVSTVAVRALEQLARDHIVRVREALATAIKDIACAPPSVVATLARDVERTVAEPVLRC